MSPLRIVLVFEYPTLNGGERSMLACVDWLQQSTHPIEFHAVAPGEGPLAEALRTRSIPLDSWPASRRHSTDRRAHLLDVLHRVYPDIVHANSLMMSRLTGTVADAVSCPTVGHLRDIVKLSSSAMADLNRNTLLLAVSDATRLHHLAQGLDAARTRTLYNGVDCETFHPDLANSSSPENWPCAPDDFVVATIGQIGLRKATDLFVEMAISVSRQIPRAQFVIVGARHSTKAESVEFEAKLHQRVQQTGFRNRVHFLGTRTDVPRILKAADLLVHPAHEEPLGRVLLEAAATGLAIVATDVGGTAEILENGISGWLVPSHSAEALEQAVRTLYENPTQRSAMGKAARERAVEKFSLPRAAEGLFQIWQATCASRSTT